MARSKLASRKRSEISRDHIDRYIATTKEALGKVRVAAPERSHNHKLAQDFLTMARSYFEDAVHFAGAGDLVNALSCVNYAHGWLDAGARTGLFDVGGDDRLFTLAE